MGKWEPILWIFGSGLGFFLFLVLLEFLKGNRKKKG
jgi:hypothetical protein